MRAVAIFFLVNRLNKLVFLYKYVALLKVMSGKFKSLLSLQLELRLKKINRCYTTVYFFYSDPAGTRTQDPYIKSVLLYQLSYGIIPFLGVQK